MTFFIVWFFQEINVGKITYNVVRLWKELVAGWLIDHPASEGVQYFTCRMNVEGLAVVRKKELV